MVSDEVRQLLAASDSRRVVMELTEQAKVDDYPRLSRALKQLRLMGVRLAIDDTGAGFASLAHILKLAPDLIKLDRELTSGIDHDPVRSALGAALVSFAVADRGGDHRRGDRDRSRARGTPGPGHSLRAGILPLSADIGRLDPEPSLPRTVTSLCRYRRPEARGLLPVGASELVRRTS